MTERLMLWLLLLSAKMTNTFKTADKLRTCFSLVSACSLRTLQGTWAALVSPWSWLANWNLLVILVLQWECPERVSALSLPHLVMADHYIYINHYIYIYEIYIWTLGTRAYIYTLVPNVHILIALRDPKATESGELSDITCMKVNVLVT